MDNTFVKKIGDLLDWFIPRDLRDDIDDYRRAKLDVAFAAAFFFLVAPPYALLYYLVGNTIGAISLLIVEVIPPFMLLTLRRTKSLLITGNIGCVALYITSIIITITTGGLESNVIGWVALTPVLAVLLCGYFSGGIWMAITTLSIIAIYLMESQGIEFRSYVSQEWWLLFYCITVAGLPPTVTLLSILFEAGKDNALGRLNQKKNDIQSMLQNMHQGIITIMENNIIHHEYSAYMETVMETDQIAGKDLMDVVFEQSNLESDALSQVESALGICIGEEKMNFAFNSHLFPTEIEKMMANGQKKYLDLSWDPICNSNDIIEKLMVSIRDTTELRQLTDQHNQQKRTLEIIGQLVEVSQEKFHAFLAESRAFLEENQQLIQNTPQQNSEVVSTLFRNMHTIKGNARTYGFLHMTNQLHEAEQEYDHLKKDPDHPWNPELLLTHIEEIKQLIDDYASISIHKLGRKGPGRRGSDEKFMMVEKVQLEQLIQSSGAINLQDPEAVQNTLKEMRRTLRLIGTESLENILSDLIDSLPSLASDMDKAEPEITFEDNRIAIKNQAASLLKNVFTHMLRNSLDHGIESPRERQEAGKSPEGHIQVHLTHEARNLVFRLKDDGRGIALGRIRQKALEQGLISEQEVLPPEETAALVFHSGFSTAEKVTEISGRGVGMEAVKSFIEKNGGSIAFRFFDHEGSQSDFLPFETVVTLPDHYAVLPE